MSISIRTRALAAIFAVTTGALLLAAGPAQATSPRVFGDTPAETCWADADTGLTQCFVDDEALAEAVTEQTGTVLVEEDTMLAGRSSSALRATYVLARLYENASYGGASTIVTSTNSATCTTGSGTAGNLLAPWNDRVSSFHSYFSCTTRIYVNSGQGGTWFGYAINAPTVGALNDAASSYKLI